MMHSMMVISILNAILKNQFAEIVVGLNVIIKMIVGVFFLLIFFSLGSALYYLVHDNSDSDRVIKALTWRIGLSILLFVLLFIAFAFGWIHPHPIGGR